MYGEGLLVRTEGHLGGRYFLDPKHQVTLHLEIGVDGVIETVSYTRGVRLPGGKQSHIPSKAVSPRLSEGEHVSFGIRLGTRAREVLATFGKPKKDLHTGHIRVIRYETTHETAPYVLYYNAEFHFKDGRLISVQLYNGE